MRAQVVRIGAGLAFGLAAGGVAHADEFDTINFDVGTSVSWNNNVFYLPAGADPNTILRQPSAADRSQTTNAGIRISKPYSLQRFELGLSFVDTKYDRFGFLGFTAKNMNAAWRWSVTPKLHGNLTATHTETLNTFLDFRNFIRNVRTTENVRFDGEYEIDGVWRILGAVQQSKVANEQTIVQQLDSRSDSVEFGGKYAFPSGSLISVISRTTRGDYYKQAQPNFVALVDNRYESSDVEGRLLWLFSGKSSVDARLSHTSRKHPNVSQRDFSGLEGGVNLNWGITGKTRLLATWSRDLSPFVTSSGSYTRMDKWTLGPVWDVTSKLVARARLEESVRDFLQPVANTAFNGRSDTMRTWFMSIDWQPYRWVTLSAFLQNDRRSSNLPGLDFNSTLTSLSAQLTF